MRGRYANHPMMRSGTRTTVDASTQPAVSENPIVTRTNARNASVRYDVNGAPNSRNDGRSATFFAHRCSLIWQRMIVAHPPMIPSAETSRTISNACEEEGVEPDAASVMTAVSRMPPYGTPVRLMTSVKRGAEPLTAIERRMRPVEYRPALRTTARPSARRSS
jgi:hypothetical protein